MLICYYMYSYNTQTVHCHNAYLLILITLLSKEIEYQPQVTNVIIKNVILNRGYKEFIDLKYLIIDMHKLCITTYQLEQSE